MWVKRLIAILAGILVVLALFAAWTAFRVKADLARAAEHATNLRDAVQQGEQRATCRQPQRHREPVAEGTTRAEQTAQHLVDAHRAAVGVLRSRSPRLRGEKGRGPFGAASRG